MAEVVGALCGPEAAAKRAHRFPQRVGGAGRFGAQQRLELGKCRSIGFGSEHTLAWLRSSQAEGALARRLPQDRAACTFALKEDLPWKSARRSSSPITRSHPLSSRLRSRSAASTPSGWPNTRIFRYHGGRLRPEVANCQSATMTSWTRSSR